MIDERIRAGDLDLLGEQPLMDFVQARRWFGSKSEEVTHANVVDAAVLRSEVPMLVAAIAEIRFQPGTHELYQLLLGFRPADEGWRRRWSRTRTGRAPTTRSPTPSLRGSSSS